MRNLTVNTIHTYYVLAGNTPVLVHHVSGCKVYRQLSYEDRVDSTTAMAWSLVVPMGPWPTISWASRPIISRIGDRGSDRTLRIRPGAGRN
jgi:hypothetical protein